MRRLVLLLACLVTACSAPPAPPEVERMIHKLFDPYGQGNKAVRVFKCESGLNPLAGYPNAYYKGVAQLGPHIVAIHAYGGNFFDAYQNLQAARDLFVSRGRNFSAWPVCGQR